MTAVVFRPAPASPQSTGVTVFTWNIHFEEADEIAEVIARSGAGIVALQEVDAHRRRSGCVDQAAEIAAALGMTAVYGANLVSDPECGDGGRALHGDAILTRYPIVEWRHVLLPIAGGEQRGLLEAVVDVDGRRLRVVSTHFEYRSSGERKAQAEALVDHVGNSAEPVVVMGDLNGEPNDSALAPMRKRFTDAWEAAGRGAGFTNPSHAPRRRIDYVFVGGGFTPTQTEVVDSGASDHLPVRADLAL